MPADAGCTWGAQPHGEPESGTPRGQALGIGIGVRTRALHLCPTATPWTVAPQPPLSVGFSRQEYWAGLPCLPPGDISNPGTEMFNYKRHKP